MLFPCTGWGQSPPSTWTERDTRLANEYLSLLVEQPEYGRVLDLLWTLYEKHDATRLLVENVTNQAAQTPHFTVKLVEAHLVRRSGDLKKAAQLYDDLLKSDAENLLVIRARADVAQEMGDATVALEMMKQLAEKLPDTDPAKAAAWLDLGGLALAAGKNDEAGKAWERAAALRPQDFNLIRQVAQLLLQAGYPDRAAQYIEKLTQQSDPQRRLEALSDLARIQEYADQFAKADQTFKTGLALLHFRDGRYAEFFRRRVRLHERFGALEDLRKQLLTAAEKPGATEQQLYDMATFFEITVEFDERIHWLRALVKAAPKVDDYRWELVKALLDHEGAAEAARLMDERLKADGSDLLAIVFLRCEADLRLGNTAAATQRLTQFLAKQGNSADVEKQALAFAQQRALDAVIELILKARVQRQPEKSEAVFELAGFYRARRDLVAVDKLLNDFTAGGSNEIEKQRRLNDAASFMAASSDADDAVILARRAAELPVAGRLEWLRLAELLGERGETEEASDWLEKAWQVSATDEERMDVDELLFSVLMGDNKDPSSQPVLENAEFKLPDAFTGKGFATGDNEPEAPANVSDTVVEKAKHLLLQTRVIPAQTDEEKQLANTQAVSTETKDKMLFRTVWWSVRAGLVQEAYQALLQLATQPTDGRIRELSLEAERLRLELALGDDNWAQAKRSLEVLIQRDPSNEVRYILRLGELLMEAEQQNKGMLGDRGWRSEGTTALPGEAATRLLEAAYRNHPDSEQLLSALTQCYTLQRKPDDAVALWRAALKRQSGSAAVPLMERFAELHFRLSRVQDYVKVQVDILGIESDVKRRREAFKRFLDRLLWVDGNPESSPTLIRDRLAMAQRALQDQARRYPFDGFYQEALAQVFSRGGDNAKAFAAMKQAYYTTPDMPFSLDQLREAALKVGDIKAAIYFQKQIVASASPQDLAAESRKLVELLEQTLQIAEADRVRRNLESRFSQDAAALEDLAGYYQSTGQDDSERRVYEQIAKVRPWDARAQFRIALKCIRLADDKAAVTYLREILKRTESASAKYQPDSVEQLPLPLTDLRREELAGPVSEVTALLEVAPGIEKLELDRLRGFLNLPRQEFVELPQEVKMIRLRVIEELARLLQQRGGAELEAWTAEWAQRQKAQPVEALWAFYYADAGQSVRNLLETLLGKGKNIEESFCYAWLTLKSQGMSVAIQWARQAGIRMEVLEVRQKLLHASVSMLAGLETFRFNTGELSQLANSRVLRNAPVLEITRKLQDQQRYEEALELGEGLRSHSIGLTSEYAFYLSRIAESAERWDLARDYLKQVVQGPIQPGGYRSTYDPYLFSLSAVTRIAATPEQRQEVLRRSWQALQKTPDSALTSMRRAAVAGLSGDQKTASRVLNDFIGSDFLTARTLEEPKGMLMPQGSPRQEEPLHLRGLWEETREIEASLIQQGLAPVVNAVNEQMGARWGGVQLSPRTGLEFGEWRLNALLRNLREVDHPTRLRLIRQHLASVDMNLEVSVDTLSELGGRLESAGMAREAIEVYRQLPARAPSNPEYATWLIRACEAAQEIEPGLAFSLKLLLAEPQLKPPAVGDETLREKHAHFLALNFDLDELHRRGFLPQITLVLQGRIPAEVPYLKELAILHERMGHDEQALSAWERLHEVFVFNKQRGVEPDIESSLYRARLLKKKGQPAAALEALREVPLVEPFSKVARESMNLRAALLASTGGWDEFRRLMPVAVDRKALDSVIHFATLLREHERTAETLNFLTQAERSFKEDDERFSLRLEKLRVLASDPTWNPERGRGQVSALLRVSSRDRDVLKRWMQWLKEQARGPGTDAWVNLLRSESRAGTDRPAAALGLCVFAEKMGLSAEDDILSGWERAEEKDRVCLDLGIDALLEAKRAQWAWKTYEVLRDIPTLRQEGRNLPVSLRVVRAMGDEIRVREIFSEVIRMPFPGGSRTVEWAKAFEDGGQPGLARELYAAALKRLENTNAAQGELWSEWVRFLIRSQDYATAETVLMKENWEMGMEAAKVIFELYRAWDRLPSIEMELTKFHLPGGVAQEARFLAAQVRNLPAPQPLR